jgi:hypothetical protein
MHLIPEIFTSIFGKKVVWSVSVLEKCGGERVNATPTSFFDYGLSQELPY